MIFSLNVSSRAGLCLMIAAASGSPAACAGLEPRETPINILILYPGDPFLPAVVAQMTPLRETISSGAGRPVNIYSETLDPARLSPSDFDKEVAAFIRHKYRDYGIDLIIAGAVGGVQFLERNRSELWPEIPAMFLSVDEASVRGKEFAQGMPGVTIRFDPQGTIDLAFQLKPRARRLVVVAGVTEMDRYWIPVIQSHLQTHYPSIDVNYLTNHTVPDIAASLQKLPADSVVLVASFVKDASGRRYIGRDVISRLSAVSSAPIFCIYDTVLGYGPVGGVVPDFPHHGHQAGQLALEILAHGVSQNNPMRSSSPTFPMVDWRELRRWKISEARLPAGTQVRFRVPTFWEQYRWRIIAIVALCLVEAVLIVVLLLSRRRLRQTRGSLKQSEQRLSLATTESQRAEEAAREVSGRLITAQEDERRRIARDLHDDLNQRLALLSVELELIGREPAGSTELPRRFEGMAARLKDLSSEVHKLSYELHPAKLDQLGLLAASGSFCRELSVQSGVEIQFSSEGMPRRMPPELELCLYRVLQEACQNLVKHSGAKRAEVEFSRRNGTLTLAVSDCGNGFDVEAGRRKGGLGMLSMQERVRLVHGELHVHSKPNEGTRVEVTVPVPETNNTGI